MTSNQHNEVDKLAVNIDKLITHKIEEYSPKVNNFFKALNKVIERNLTNPKDKS